MTEQKILNIINSYVSYINDRSKEGLVKDITKYYKDRIKDKEQKILEQKLELREYEAKVYAYEKIIANSNFRALLEEPKKEKKKKVRGEDNE